MASIEYPTFETNLVMRGIILLMGLWFGINRLQGQSFPHLDSLSEYYIQKGEWKQVELVSKQLYQNGYKYSRLYAQWGNSYTQQGYLYKALGKWQQAYPFHTFDSAINTQLAYISFMLGQNQEAAYYLNRLPQLSKTIYKSVRPQFVYIESGVKFSNALDIAGHLSYMGAFIQTPILKKSMLHIGINGLTQNLVWGKVQQTQVMAGYSSQINPYWSYEIHGMGGFSDNQISTQELSTAGPFRRRLPGINNYIDSTVQSTENWNGTMNRWSYGIMGGVMRKSYHYELGVMSGINGITDVPNIVYQKTQATRLVTTLNGSIRSDKTSSKISGHNADTIVHDIWWQTMGQIKWNIYAGKTKLAIGLRGFLLLRPGEFATPLIPNLSWHYLPKHWISADYMRKGPYILFDPVNALGLNNYDEIQYRFRVTSSHVIHKKIRTDFTFIAEKQTESINQKEFSLYSLFIGLSYRL